MPKTSYSADIHATNARLRAQTGTPTFAYSQQQAELPRSQRTANALVNPFFDLSNKKPPIRESRDSAEFPRTKSIVLCLDVSASMSVVLEAIHASLPKVNGILLRDGAVEYPQIMIMAIGDTHGDSVPFQASQFELGNEIDDCAAAVYLEQGGGEQTSPPKESYELGMYYAARHTSIDCFEKRNEKGYFIIFGDESPYEFVRRSDVQQYIGVTLEADIPIVQIVKELQEKYHVFMIIPQETDRGRNTLGLKQRWQALLGENVLELTDMNAAAETAAVQIGLMEGLIDDLDDAGQVLSNVGASASVVNAVKNSVVVYQNRGSKAVATVSGGNLPDLATAAAPTTRI